MSKNLSNYANKKFHLNILNKWFHDLFRHFNKNDFLTSEKQTSIRIADYNEHLIEHQDRCTPNCRLLYSHFWFYYTWKIVQLNGIACYFISNWWSVRRQSYDVLLVENNNLPFAFLCEKIFFRHFDSKETHARCCFEDQKQRKFKIRALVAHFSNWIS